MQVLLIQDVDNLGYAGDVKKVADGFGRNYLLPRNLAVLATPGALKQAETIRKAAEKRRAHEMADAQAMANQLAGLELLFERRAGETGKLYGSVTSGDIADSIKAKSGLEVDKRKVALPEPIRQLGDQEVIIKLMIDVATTIKVHVLPEGGILERERLTKAEEEKLLAEVGESVEEVRAEAEIEEERPAAAAGAEAEVEQPAQEVETEAEAEQPAEEIETGAEAEA
ncbi:MAG TPA: 50S ribosomal protein L9 [Anaerolineae bacterium]|nr:50S ribosomal protein L9 [Anaerolineae bacterium]